MPTGRQLRGGSLKNSPPLCCFLLEPHLTSPYPKGGNRIAPFRRISILPSVETFATVDGFRRGNLPMSTTTSGWYFRPLNTRRTPRPERAEGRPDGFADVETIGNPYARASVRTKGEDDTRIATSPRTAMPGAIRADFLRGRMRVKGPGQCVPASVALDPLRYAIFLTCADDDATSKNGCSFVRPLILKIRLTARAFLGSHPKPYVVSVGYAITPPRRRAASASG